MEGVSQISHNNIIAGYYYTHGAGRKSNRYVEFLRQKENDPTTLIARFKGDFEGEWRVSTELHASHIEVEMINTTQKMKNLMAAERHIPEVPKQTIDQFEPREQDSILQSLVPRGSRRMEVENHPGGLNGFERVEVITIFDPT